MSPTRANTSEHVDSTMIQHALYVDPCEFKSDDASAVPEKLVGNPQTVSLIDITMCLPSKAFRCAWFRPSCQKLTEKRPRSLK